MGNNHFKGISIKQALPSKTKNYIIALALRENNHYLCKFELDEKYLLSKIIIVRKAVVGS